MSTQNSENGGATAPDGTLAAVLMPRPTRADRLRALEQEFNATFERRIRASDGAVVLRLIFKETEDAVSGVGATTEEALVSLEARMNMFRGA